MAHASSSDDPDKQASELRAQMRTIRRELGQDVEVLVEHAENLMDWRYHVRRYPWVIVGAATFLGYFLVPKRTVTLPTDAHTLAQLGQRIPVVMQAPPEVKKPGIIGSLLTMGTNLAMRAALAYIGQEVGKIMGHKAAEQQPQEAHHYG